MSTTNSDLIHEYGALLRELDGHSLNKSRIFSAGRLRGIGFLGDIALYTGSYSLGGIGEKPYDYFRASYEPVVRHALSVPLIEMLCAGVTPTVVIDNLCMQMNPFGKRVIAALSEELRAIGFDPARGLTGSTEDNSDPAQSGIVITVIGIGDRTRTSKAPRSGDAVYCVGSPAPFTAIGETALNRIDLPTAKLLCDSEVTRGIAPVDESGACGAAGELAQRHGLTFIPAKDLGESTTMGDVLPCSAVLVTVNPKDAETFLKSIPVGAELLGTVK